MAEERKDKTQDIGKIEHDFLKGTRDENLGVYIDMFSAKSSIDGQDGGVVTALLIAGLRKSMFDTAIVVQRREGYTAEPVATENANEIMAARGTKYLRVKMMPKLRELLKQGKICSAASRERVLLQSQRPQQRRRKRMPLL